MHTPFLILAICVYSMVNGQEGDPSSALRLRQSCPTNEAFQHDGVYYQFFDCLMTWDQAEATCKNSMVVKGRNVFGGHLVSVLNQEENDWLKFQLDMRYGAKVGVWLGAKRGQHSSNSCPNYNKWTDGNRMSYTNFIGGQPNCRWPGEDCLHLIDNEQWNDAECQGYMRFVCKLKLANFDIVEPPGK